jgi:hypothetical protein
MPDMNIQTASPAVKMTDHFTPIPPEVIQSIASYLYATHVPDKAYNTSRHPRLTSTPKSKPTSSTNDLIALALTSKPLFHHTNAWAHHFLHTHRSITKYKDPKTALAISRQKLPLRILLHWSSKSCVFCGKKTLRSAILMNGLRCCRACDRAQWPEKITKTDAMKNFALREDQLLPSQHHAKKLLTLHPGLPMLRYGTYFSAGVLTTMFLKADVEAFAELARGDLKGHLKMREVARRERGKVAVKTRVVERQLETEAAVEARQIGAREVVVIDDDDEEEGRVGDVVGDGQDGDPMFNTPVVVDDD